MTTTRTGRPRQFDIDEALDFAIELFWAKGYDGTSLTDLTNRLGITRPSLYAAFGDKRGIFLQAIERYSDSTECPPIVAFEAEPKIEKAVRSFLADSIEYLTTGKSQRGCFLGSCVATSAGEVEGVRELLKKIIDQTDSRLAKRFELEKKNRVLPNKFPSIERARLMVDLRQGFAFRARSGADPRSMKADIQKRVDLVLRD